MKRFFPLLSLLLVLSFVLSVPAFASEIDSNYPSYDEFTQMYNVLPSKYDGHAIVVGDSGPILYAWDTSMTYMTTYWYSGDEEFTFYIHENTKDTGMVFLYRWNDSTRKWVYVSEYGYSLGANLPQYIYYSPDDYVYGSYDIPSWKDIQYDGILVGYGVSDDVNAPEWNGMKWTDYGDWSKLLVAEIVGMLPILVVVVFGFIEIRKGIKFIMDMLRSS